MFLPDLDVNIPETRQSCSGVDRCTGCRLFKGNKGVCKGCNPKCRMAVCETQCGRCGGNVIDVPAVCIKSPLRDLLMKQVESLKGWHKRPPIKLKTRGMLVTIGGRSSVFGPGECPYAPEVEAVGVNLRHVWSARGGWYSKDMKDYMRVPKEKKLFLLTASYDDQLDKAWTADLFDGFKDVGFDFWSPLLFSAYENDACMNQIWNYLRTLHSLKLSKGHFCDLPSRRFDLSSDFFRTLFASVPNIMTNTQIGQPDDSWVRGLYADITHVSSVCPPDATFWLLGVNSPKVLTAALLAASGRDVYATNTNVWIAAHKGYLFTPDGSSSTFDRSMPKKDVILESQRNFLKMVDSAYAKARLLMKGV